jgi:sn-2 palmitoyl-lipid 9-desaturase
LESDRKKLGVFVWRPVLTIFFVHILGISAVFFWSWSNLVGFLISHFFVCCIGLVIGAHRYFSHKSFRTNKVFEGILGILATLNLQNGPITWAMYHRAHHRFTDGPGDPHASTNGFFWSHIQWLFYISPNGFRKKSVTVRDLTSSSFLLWLDKNHGLFNVLAACIFFFIVRDWGLFLWVIPFRIMVVWHSTWLINSYVHSAGASNVSHFDRVKNSVLASGMTYGEGWHLNHHRYPYLPRAGLQPFQYDPAYWVLVVLRCFGLVQFNNIDLVNVRS